ncbi:c-type cytochrome [Pseudomonas sp. PD9R]|uniref:c-type cytochrome n=1 Tax=Pseudomonas sp. PD9R TaxID=2853534 RepID=UPI001C474A22|nr:c-type cytochrome [Pseudomonas sp. PD9R]MBV6824221.1 c-type cytochrome [Pseudomonas sp. PD9R]
MPKTYIYLLMFALPFSERLLATEKPSIPMIANSCTNCHGMRGVSTKGIPSIAGLPKKYLIDRLQGYRDNSINGTIMNRIMEKHNDKEITELADHYSKINTLNSYNTDKSTCGKCHEHKPLI